MRALAFQAPHLRSLLAFIGLSDVPVICAEGVALGGDARERAMAAAKEAVEALFAAPTAFRVEGGAPGRPPPQAIPH